jgi:hypothetical protein
MTFLSTNCRLPLLCSPWQQEYNDGDFSKYWQGFSQDGRFISKQEIPLYYTHSKTNLKNDLPLLGHGHDSNTLQYLPVDGCHMQEFFL